MPPSAEGARPWKKPDNRAGYRLSDPAFITAAARAARRAARGVSSRNPLLPRRRLYRGTGYDQLAGSRDAPGAAAARVIREARDACRDFVRKRVGGTWVAISDILELLFEIAFRG